MLQFFDVHVHADAIDEARLENLSYFNVKSVLVTAHAPRPFQSSVDVLAYFNELVTSERVRLQRGGIQPLFALGVHPGAVPRRVHYELWRELPPLLSERGVVAVGELALEKDNEEQVGLLRRQIRLAHELGMPCLVSPGVVERARLVRRALEVVEEVGIDPSRVLVDHVEQTSVRRVLEAGCWAGFTVGPWSLSPQEAARLVLSYRVAAVERGVFGSSLRVGPGDVLALPKAAMALIEAGLSGHEVRRLVWGNAQRLLGI